MGDYLGGNSKIDTVNIQFCTSLSLVLQNGTTVFLKNGSYLELECWVKVGGFQRKNNLPTTGNPN